MKYLFLTLSILLSQIVSGQSLLGAWESTQVTEDGEQRVVVILTNKFQVATWYDSETGAFVATNGGSWSKDGNTVTELVEFDTRDSSRVGTTVTFDVEFDDEEMSIVGSDQVFKRIDSGTPGKLSGAWLMSGRIRNGEMSERNVNRPRKTMKILSGTRFQWIAYNTETKRFMGTGGGSYTTIDGKYTENIEFFSRDNTRVGAALEFNYELKEEKWHHSGNNSRGEPLYEIWSPRIK